MTDPWTNRSSTITRRASNVFVGSEGALPIMSVDQAFREMIRAEIEGQLRPLRSAVDRLSADTEDLSALRNLAARLTPFTEFFTQGLNGARGTGRRAGAVRVPTMLGRK